MFGELYHNRVLELAADIPHDERLVTPQGSAHKISRICGSEVYLDINLDSKGQYIEAIGIDPRACALGQATSSILTRYAIEAPVEEIIAAHSALRAMLYEKAPPPKGRFWELRHLQAVQDYPPRYASTLLAFEAAVEAIALAQAHLRLNQI